MNKYYRVLRWLWIGILSLTCAQGGAAPAMTGPAIYVGGLASPMEVYAARELQRYIYQVSGALPEIRAGVESIDSPGFILGTTASNPLIAKLAAEQQVTLSATDPGPQGYVLKKLRVNGREVLVVAGSDVVGTLYGVYGLLQDHYGIAFYLGGDVLPDERVSAGWLPEVNERKKPAVGIRGLLPWTNFPQSATSYSWEDWKFILDQMAKMRLNFLHIHNYNGEAGHNEMFHNVAQGGITPRVWMATARSGHAWGGRPVGTRTCTVSGRATCSMITTSARIAHGTTRGFRTSRPSGRACPNSRRSSPTPIPAV